MKLLALDIGAKRTGVAFADEEMGIALPLQTIEHSTPEELLASLQVIVKERSIDRCIVGLPLLLSGAEGSQAELVRSYVQILEEGLSLPFQFRDERLTTPRQQLSDGDAAAACTLLLLFLQQGQK